MRGNPGARYAPASSRHEAQPGPLKLLLQAQEEVGIPRQAIELRYNQRRVVQSAKAERVSKLRPFINLAALDLDELGDH